MLQITDNNVQVFGFSPQSCQVSALVKTVCFALRYFTYLQPLKNLTEYPADIPEILHLCDDNDEGGADNVFLIPKPLTN